jgi:hypothetical protein
MARRSTEMGAEHVRVLETFFEPWPPEEKIGGWRIVGHDATDTRKECIVAGPAYDMLVADLIEEGIPSETADVKAITAIELFTRRGYRIVKG